MAWKKFLIAVLFCAGSVVCVGESNYEESIFYLDHFYVNFYFAGDKNEGIVFFTAENPAFTNIHFWGKGPRDHFIEYTTAKEATATYGISEVRKVSQLPGSLEGFSVPLLLTCKSSRRGLICEPPSDLEVVSKGGSCEFGTNTPSKSNRYGFGIKSPIHPLHVKDINVKKMPQIMIRGCNCEQKFPFDKAELKKLLPDQNLMTDFYYGGSLLKLRDGSYLGAYYHFGLTKQIWVGDGWDFQGARIDQILDRDVYKYIINFPTLATVQKGDLVMTLQQLIESLKERR